MMARHQEEGRLDLEVQRKLGAALRAEYGSLIAQLPERFIRLLLPLRELRGTRRHDPADAAPASSPLFAETNFDPETITVLTESLEEGWDTLQSIGNITITRE